MEFMKALYHSLNQGDVSMLEIPTDVLSLGNSTRINERCLELQKKKKNEATRVKKSSPEALGLNLISNIVIIDEAHDLADSFISMYDSKITLSRLENVHCHVERHFVRFRSLLGPANRRYIQTLMVLTQEWKSDGFLPSSHRTGF
ncbi:hypothetical protein AHAS_Ahas20G0014100 [Arachis hypogaea]